MNHIAAGALAAFMAVTPTPVFATETPDLEIQHHTFLVTVVEQLGIKVNFGGSECQAHPGLYGNYLHDGSRLNLCPVGDRDERLDTMRHESWHVYQDLADCNIRDTKYFSSVFGGRGVTSQFTSHASKHYEAQFVPTESEAFWAASTFDALTIANLIIQKGEECGHKFNFN